MIEYVALLIAYAKKYLGLCERDEIYVRNRLMDILGVSEITHSEQEPPALPNEILEGIFTCLEKEGREFDRATLGEKLMDAVMLLPSAHEETFYRIYKSSPQKATAWAYDYAVHSDYVKQSAIARNLKWTSKNGRLEITINLSKPEKDNKDLIKQIKTVSTSYPKCTICRENEGYERAGFSRRNMRTVSVKLGGEDWFWQYSPYAYFNEHGIVISVDHTPMVLNEKTAEYLFDFVDLFPHYFIGNNAPLPRVGGSILMHNHFQGGGYEMPMQRAPIGTPLVAVKYSGVRIGIVDWYNTALRLEGERKGVAALAREIFTAWETYENPALEILSHTGEERHNTASLIARKRGGRYIMDVILRNNRVNEKHPGGIFHAHREYHHIKSESIGLIEAMGLFILPARLKRQLGELKQYLTGERAYCEEALTEDMQLFIPTIRRLMKAAPVSEKEAEDMLRDEVELTCEHILENTAVFKEDTAGRCARTEFLLTCGLQERR